MDTKDFKDFIVKTFDYLSRQYPEVYADPEKRLYAHTIKLGEEVGELNEAVLAHFARQRSSKSKKYDPGAEIADIIIVLHLLALDLKVDVDTVLRQKVTALTERHKG